MAFFSEIYFSKLIGAAVFDVAGEYIGQFRDFIVKAESGTFVVTKVRIRISKQERVIVPWDDVLSIEVLPIVLLKLKKKKEELQSTEYSEEECRLKRDLLDQQVIDTNNYKVVRVNDLKLIAVKDHVFVVGVDVGLRGLLRRIGWEKFGLIIAKIFHITMGEKLINARNIDPFPARVRHDIRLKTGHEQLIHMHPADLADVIEELDHFERMTVVRSLDTEALAETISELEPKVRADLLRRLKDATVKTVLEKLEPDEAADIVAQFPKARAKHLLENIKKKTAEDIKELAEFRADTAGGLMTTKYVAFAPNLTAAQALHELRAKAKDVEMISHTYLVDEQGLFIGTVALRNILFAEPETPLISLSASRSFAVRPSMPAKQALRRMAKYDLIALPVIDHKKQLKGIVTVDDALTIITK